MTSNPVLIGTVIQRPPGLVVTEEHKPFLAALPSRVRDLNDWVRDDVESPRSPDPVPAYRLGELDTNTLILHDRIVGVNRGTGSTSDGRGPLCGVSCGGHGSLGRGGRGFFVARGAHVDVFQHQQSARDLRKRAAQVLPEKRKVGDSIPPLPTSSHERFAGQGLFLAILPRSRGEYGPLVGNLAGSLVIIALLSTVELFPLATALRERSSIIAPG
jgi:hypothetical protein